LQCHGAGSRFNASRHGFPIGVGRIEERGNTNGSGRKLTQELQPLCRQLTREKIDPRQIAARPGKAGD